MQINIGERVRNFRRNARISQMDLEINAGLSNGVISRIENNLINPTKETILNIADSLQLSNEEVDYIIGLTALPANTEEIERAKIEAKRTLNKRGKLVYLLDDRWRFIDISKTFVKLLKIKPREIEYILGKTTVQTVVRPDSPVLQWINQDMYQYLLDIYLPFYYSKMSYMVDDLTFQNSVDDIMRNKLAKPKWEKLVNDKIRTYTDEENRVIHFDLLGKKFPLYYSILNLPQNSRFGLVEYHTKNAILDLIPYLF